MFRDWKTFITWEKSTKDTLDVKVSYIDVAGGVMEGILLSQIVYWYLPNKEGKSKLRIRKENHFWIAKTMDEWHSEIRFTRRNYDTAMKKLVEKNLVVKKIFKFNNTPTTHIRLNVPVFLTSLNALMKEQSDNLKSNEFDEFDTYLMSQMTTEPLETVDLYESYKLKSTKRTNGNVRNVQMEMPESYKSITETTAENTTENTTENTYLSEIENATIAISIKRVLKDKVDRLVSDEIKIYEIENHIEANNGIINKSEYARILKWCLDSTEARIRDYSALMDKNINNHLKMKSSKVAEAKKGNLDKKPLRKEMIPSFFGANKEKIERDQPDNEENLDDIQEMIKNLRSTDKQE